MEKDTQFKKNFIWNTIGNTLSAFNSLFFMIIATRINGLNDAGIFTLAFSTACILFAVGIYAGRVYQVTELDKKISDKDFIINRTISCLTMIILLLCFCFIKRYDFTKTTIFLLLTLYKAFDAFSDVIYGILQKNDKLEIVGKSLSIKSILSLFAFLVFDLIFKNIIIASLSVVLVYLIVLIVYDYRNAYKYINFETKINIKNVLNIFKNGFFVFAISFLGMYVVNAPKYSIDNFLENDILTIFGIIVMPATIMSLVAQFLIHPYLNEMLRLYEEKDENKFKKLVLKIILMIIVFGIFATIIGFLIGTQVLGFIYGIDLSTYKIQLAVIIISATLYTIGTVCSSVLTTFRDTFSQFIIYVIVTLIAYISSNLCTKYFEFDGAIFAYALIMFAQSLLYLTYTQIKIKKVFKGKE